MRKHYPWLFGLLVVFLGVVRLALATPPQPGWWTDTTNGTAILNGNTANNLAPANLGQLKYVATQAKKYLDFKLSGNGGAGADIDALVGGFSFNPDVNYDIINNGQLKYVGQMFYDRLFSLGYNISNSTLTVDGLPGNWTFTGGNISGNIYPWLWVAPGGTSPAWLPPGPYQSGYNGTTYPLWLQKQYAPANLGQLKFVFSFDLGNLTSNATSVAGPTSGNYLGRVLSSTTSGTDDGDDDDDTFTIDGTDDEMTSLPAPQYTGIDIGAGVMVDMNDSAAVLIYQSTPPTPPANTPPSYYSLWAGGSAGGLYTIPQPNPYDYFSPGNISVDGSEIDVTNGNADVASLDYSFPLFNWYRVDDNGRVLGISDGSQWFYAANYTVSVDDPAYWTPGMSEPATLDVNRVSNLISVEYPEGSYPYYPYFDPETINFAYGDSGGNIYFSINDDGDDPDYIYLKWDPNDVLSLIGDSYIDTNFVLAATDDYILSVDIDFSDVDETVGNLSINGTQVATDVPADPASLIAYSNQFSEWAGLAALGGNAPAANSASIFLGGNVSLNSQPGGNRQTVTSLSSLGIATTGNGTIWEDNQTWNVGGDVWVDQVTGEDGILVGHVGMSANMSNSSVIVLLTPDADSTPVNFTQSTSEGSGARYRKIGLNGRPLPDGKPQTAPESDHQPEETFIDALTQGLRHNVTDLYTPVAGTDLPLSVTRVYNEEIWDIGAGLQPTEHYLPTGVGNVAHTTWPFGPAWRSNIVPNVELEYKGDSLLDAYVTDEDGDQYHFLGGFINIDPATGNYSATPYFNFLPYPTSQHDKNTFLATLTVDGSRTLAINSYNGTYANLTFTKKYGTSVTYTYASNLTQAETTADDSPDETFAFYRAQEANDRLGYQLNYHFPSSTALVPDYIYMGDATGNHTPIPGAYMNITTYSGNVAWNGLVENITDADGKQTSYTYGNFTDTSNTTTAKLTSVTDAEGENVTYGYDMVLEPDTAPYPLYYDGHFPDYDHLEVANITDQNGNEYQFSYGFSYNAHQTTGFFSTNQYGTYPAAGRPRLVEQVTMPNGANVTLSSNINVRVQGDANHLGLAAGKGGFARNLTVTDADGNNITYSWENPQVVEEDEPPALQSAGSFAANYVVLYPKMTIDYGSIGGTDLSESFVFNPKAGMALELATDMSGATTQYTYGDAWSAPAYYKQILPDLADLVGNYDDPTEETDANGGVKKFAYNDFRLMSDIVDANGNLTHYIFDDGGTLTLGLRTAEQHFVGNTTGGTLVAETDYTYGNTAFPGALTQKNIRSLSGDPGWTANLTTNYTLTNAGRVAEEIVNPASLALTTAHTYSNTGDLLSTTDPLGNVTNMTYDNRHRLTEVEYPDSSTRNYTYDDRGNELSEEDEDGHFTYKDYDSLNRLTSSTRVLTGGNLTTRYTYSNTSARLSVEDPNGYTTSYEYDALNRLTLMSTPEVEINGNTTAVALNTTYSYDPTHNPGGSVFDSSSFKPTTVTDPRGYTSNFTYDPLGRVTNEQVTYDLTDNYSTNVTYSYDPNDNLTEKDVYLGDAGTQSDTYAYDSLNRLITTEHLFDNSTVTANYTSTGLPYLKTDELGRQTQTEYDAAGRPTVVSRPDPAYGNISANSPNLTTTYDANGNALSVEDPDGNTVDYVYNSRNRRTKTTFPAAADWLNSGASTAGNSTTTYDDTGNVLTVTNQLGQTTTTVYDAANRPTDVFTPAVSVWNGTGSTSLDLVTHTIYDGDGNVLYVQQGTATGNSTGDETLARNTTANTYDALNRLTQTTDGANITVSYDYDAAGNRVLVSDGLGQNTTYTFDGLNRVLTIAYPVGNDTVYTYEPTHVLSVEYGNVTGANYTYDARDRMTARNGYDYAYDDASQLLAVTSDAGEEIYDPYDTFYYSTVYYAHDDDGRVTAENQGGWASGTYAGNIATVTNGTTNTFTYDKAGNRLSVVYGSGVSGNRTLDSVYDALNRVSNITDVTSGNLVTTYHYDLAGHRVGLLYPSGSNITTTFDAVGRQTEIKGTGNATTTRYDYTLAYDEYQNLGRQVETYANGSLLSRNVTLSYDGTDRLTSEVLAVTNATNVTTAITNNYTYDAGFNRTKKVTTQEIGGNTGNETTEANITYDYNTGDQLLWDHDTVANSTANFTYDNAGNRIKELLNTATVPNATVATNLTTAQFASSYANEIDYGYDQFNRLANVTLNGNYSSGGNHTLEETLTYIYDYQNRRMVRGDTQTDWVAGSTPVNQVWQEVYDGYGPVRDDYASAAGSWSLGISEDWVRGSDWGGGIGGVLYAQSLSGNSNTPKYYHYDGRGDVVALTSNTGALLYQAAYNAYGLHSNTSTMGTEESGTDSDLFRLTTKEEDPTGLSYQINRPLSLGDNNWMSKDPAGMINGPNPYTYVGQNDWTKTDQLGLYWGEPVVNYAGGTVIGVGEAITGHAAGQPSSMAEYNGRNFGRNLTTTVALGTMAKGLTDITIGGGMAATSVTVEVGSGGTATLAAGPGLAIGTAKALVGTVEAGGGAIVVSNSASLPALQKPAPPSDPSGSAKDDKGPPNPNGSKGAPDHQEATKKLVDDMADRHPDADEIRSNQSIKDVSGIDRRPDGAVIKDGKVVEVGEAARTKSDGETLVSREQAKQQQYNDAGIPSTVVKLPSKPPPPPPTTNP